MLEIKGRAFSSAMAILVPCENPTRHWIDDETHASNVAECEDQIMRSLADLKQSCASIGARFAILSINRTEALVYKHLRSDPPRDDIFIPELRIAIGEIHSRFCDEIEDCKLFGLNNRECEFLISPSQSIMDAFSMACLTLRRQESASP